jgi:hypothetical protein
VWSRAKCGSIFCISGRIPLNEVLKSNILLRISMMKKIVGWNMILIERFFITFSIKMGSLFMGKKRLNLSIKGWIKTSI